MRRRIDAVRRLRGRRTAAVLVASPVVALTVAGCASFSSDPAAAQPNVIGDATVHTEVCLNGFGTGTVPTIPPIVIPPPVILHPSSARASTTTTSTTTTSAPTSDPSCAASSGYPTGQLLVGYLVPDGASAPQTLTSTDASHTTFAQFPGYAQWLSGTADAAPGTLPDTHWVGYLSREMTSSGSTTVTLDASFGLPQDPDGTPYAGPFDVQTAIGDRAVIDADPSHGAAGPGGPSEPADRPLDCGGEAIGPYNLTACNEGVKQVTLQTRDLTVTAPRPVSVQAGQRARLGFTLAYAGAVHPAPTFALAASDDAPGATATAAETSFAPRAAGNATEVVSLRTPATLSPGTYHVTLDAAAACADRTRCTRAASATVRVTAPPASDGPGGSATTGATPGSTGSVTAPAPTVPAPRSAPSAPLRFAANLVSVGRPRQGSLYAHGWRLKLYCNQACAVSSSAFVYHGTYYHGRRVHGARDPIAHIVVGGRVFNLARAGHSVRYIQLDAAAIHALKRAGLHRFRINLHLWATDAHGGQRTPRVRRQVWIRR